MVKGVHDEFEPVHVVPVDVPIAQVSVRRVFDVSNVLGHDLPGRGLVVHDALLQHGHLQFAEDGLQLELGLVELLEEVSVVEHLVQHHLLQSDREFLQRGEHLHQRGVDLRERFALDSCEISGRRRFEDLDAYYESDVLSLSPFCSVMNVRYDCCIFGNVQNDKFSVFGAEKLLQFFAEFYLFPEK